MSRFYQSLHARIYYVYSCYIDKNRETHAYKVLARCNPKEMRSVKTHYDHYNFQSGSNHVASLKQILRDTKQVTDWYSLGIYLGIPTSYLKHIEKNYSSDTERCRIEVIDCWLHSDPEPTQRNLAQAVEDMGGHADVVQTLRARYEGW